MTAGTARHQIVVCTTCRHLGSDCRPGLELIDKLRAGVRLAQQTGLVGDDFAVEGFACMAGCSRPCTVAYRADGKCSYLFGDIDADADIDDLLAFAALYADRQDGWSRSAERPGGLSGKTLARIPAALVVTRTTGAPAT